MKKSFLFLSTFTVILAACNSSNTSSTTNTTPAASTKAATDGQLLIDQSDCVGCHAKENKIIGPSYLEIAAKYPSTEANINLLASKIIKGGTGVWGNVPMTPHPNITENDAKLMSKYILSLRK